MPAGPLSPADSLNQISAALGTPNDSTGWATALSSPLPTWGRNDTGGPGARYRLSLSGGAAQPATRQSPVGRDAANFVAGYRGSPTST
jgi:hypothetical protein